MSRWIDAYGTPITEGARVAYNMGGDVMVGEVLGFTPNHAKIRLLRGTGRHISKVKRPRSILVLVQAP